VQPRLVYVIDLDEAVRTFVGSSGTPLLQLDYDKRVATSRMRAGKDDVNTLVVERQLVLHQHLHGAEPRVDQVARQGWQATPPRPLLWQRRPSARLLEDPVGQRPIRG
jgi:hypothetical protein